MGSQQLLDVGLRQDAEDGAAVGRVVNIGAGEELIDDVFHFVVGEHLTVGDGRGARQRQG